MVLGMGNAAMETADALAPYANYVHVIPGRLHEHMAGPDKHNVLSWESRYVGNVRAINAGLFDAYRRRSTRATPRSQIFLILICAQY